MARILLMLFVFVNMSNKRRPSQEKTTTPTSSGNIQRAASPPSLWVVKEEDDLSDDDVIYLGTRDTSTTQGAFTTVVQTDTSFSRCNKVFTNVLYYLELFMDFTKSIQNVKRQVNSRQEGERQPQGFSVDKNEKVFSFLNKDSLQHMVLEYMKKENKPLKNMNMQKYLYAFLRFFRQALTESEGVLLRHLSLFIGNFRLLENSQSGTPKIRQNFCTGVLTLPALVMNTEKVEITLGAYVEQNFIPKDALNDPTTYFIPSQYLFVFVDSKNPEGTSITVKGSPLPVTLPLELSLKNNAPGHRESHNYKLIRIIYRLENTESYKIIFTTNRVWYNNHKAKSQEIAVNDIRNTMETVVNSPNKDITLMYELVAPPGTNGLPTNQQLQEIAVPATSAQQRPADTTGAIRMTPTPGNQQPSAIRMTPTPGNQQPSANQNPGKRTRRVTSAPAVPNS